MIRTSILCGTLLAAFNTPAVLAQDTQEGVQDEARVLMQKMTDFYKTVDGAQFKSVMTMKAPQLPGAMEQTSTKQVGWADSLRQFCAVNGSVVPALHCFFMAVFTGRYFDFYGMGRMPVSTTGPRTLLAATTAGTTLSQTSASTT